MGHILLSICFFCLSLTLLEAQPDPKRWEKTIENFEKLDKERPALAKGGVVFTGSSSIALWKDLPLSFPGYACFNRGFGGSQLTDLNHYVDRVVTVYAPKTVVLFCGGNDLAAKRSPEQVHEAFQAFVAKVHAKLPDTRIVYISIHLPPGRVKQEPEIKKTNSLISETCKKNAKLRFLDIYPDMLGSDGKPNPDLYRDPLHPNATAYKIWAGKLEPLLRPEKK